MQEALDSIPIITKKKKKSINKVIMIEKINYLRSKLGKRLRHKFLQICKERKRKEKGKCTIFSKILIPKP
jgi:hypothetical protein